MCIHIPVTYWSLFAACRANQICQLKSSLFWMCVIWLCNHTGSNSCGLKDQVTAFNTQVHSSWRKQESGRRIYKKLCTYVLVAPKCKHFIGNQWLLEIQVSCKWGMGLWPLVAISFLFVCSIYLVCCVLESNMCCLFKRYCLKRNGTQMYSVSHKPWKQNYFVCLLLFAWVSEYSSARTLLMSFLAIFNQKTVSLSQ